MLPLLSCVPNVCLSTPCSFLSRPQLSDDGQGSDKHKMERFLQPGRSLVGSIYGPISYPPLPLLAFKVRACASNMHPKPQRVAQVHHQWYSLVALDYAIVYVFSRGFVMVFSTSDQEIVLIAK